MKSLVLPLPGNEALAASLARELSAELGELNVRRFPDGETHLRFASEVRDREVVLVCTLHDPDTRLVRLVLAADTAKELGALRVGLVAPYLAYMRQDRRFRPGEAVSARLVGSLLSRSVDWLVTIDPHLHRIASLDEVYTVPALALHAAELLSAWIREHVEDALLVGPDAESAQWVSAVAEGAGAPHLVLEKIRRGDRQVEVSLPVLDGLAGKHPVLVDDIISTARTMAETVGHLRRAGLRPPTCLGVHAVFAEGAREALEQAGVAQVITTNTIPHRSNAIDVSALLAEGVRRQLGDSM